MKTRIEIRIRKAPRTACIFAALALALPAASAQLNLQGITSPHGTLNISTTTSSATQTHQYTQIWAYAPPNTDAGAADNTNFRNVITSQGSISGVSILEAWNSIEIYPPTSTPCATSDTCQPDPAIPWMYHTYSWNTYDSTAVSGTPVYQWITMANKKVNILIAGEESGATNPITPHYVTSSAWYNLFNPQQQDVVNAIQDCAGEFGGIPPSGGAAYSTITGLVTVTDSTNSNAYCCVSPPPAVSPQGQTIQDNDLVWVTTSSTGCGTPCGGAIATVTGTNAFTYTPSSVPTACSVTNLSNVSFISAAQSWAVPYEYPYMSALQAFWAAVVAHYGTNFKLSGTSYFSRLNYFRFGGSVGSEWYPYCTSNLESLLPAAYTYSETLWLSYYKQMGNYLQSLSPPFRIIHSINAAETPLVYTYANQEAADAVGWSNSFGVRDGFGSQGLSVRDYLNCQLSCDNLPTPTNPTASNWHPLFEKYNTNGVPLELQPIALSYPRDFNCTNGCSVSTYSGDLTKFLDPFSTSVGTTDYEIYWRDLSLSYDVNNYCALNVQPPTPPPPTACLLTTSVTPGGQIPAGQQLNFFQEVGQGNNMADCGSNTPQGYASGNCAYATDINKAYGQH